MNSAVKTEANQKKNPSSDTTAAFFIRPTVDVLIGLQWMAETLAGVFGSSAQFLLDAQEPVVLGGAI